MFLNGPKCLHDELRSHQEFSCDYQNQDKTFHCVAHDFKCCLQVSEHETVFQLSQRIGKIMKCPPSDLVLICKGKVVSSHLMFSIEALCLFASSTSCKLLISQKPPGPLRVACLSLRSVTPTARKAPWDEPPQAEPDPSPSGPPGPHPSVLYRACRPGPSAADSTCEHSSFSDLTARRNRSES